VFTFPGRKTFGQDMKGVEEIKLIESMGVRLL
jgi:hypothetical protein